MLAVFVAGPGNVIVARQRGHLPRLPRAVMGMLMGCRQVGQTKSNVDMVIHQGAVAVMTILGDALVSLARDPGWGQGPQAAARPARPSSSTCKYYRSNIITIIGRPPYPAASSPRRPESGCRGRRRTGRQSPG